MADYPIHPACALWPRPSDEEMLKIAADIKANGLNNSIWLYNGAILDGKTRFEACQIAGVEPRFQEYTGNEPELFTISQNALRRHMSQGAIILIATEIIAMPRGRPKINPLAREVNSKSLPELAKITGLSQTSLSAGRSLHRNAEQNILEMVRKNEVGVQSASAFVSKTTRSKQREATAKTVKDEGYLSRRGRSCFAAKNGETNTITIPQRDVIDKLRPLIKRVKEQSDRHAATVSFMALRIIAHELKQLADSWMKNGSESGTPSEPVPLNRVQKER